jgi:type I restriction enzyme, R subunit
VQLGLTATPKEETTLILTHTLVNLDISIHFKEGIGDGFLTPFRVRKYQTTIDEYTFVPDDTVVTGEVEAGRIYTEKDFQRLIIIKEREVYRVELFLAQIDPNEKTIIFCATQAHALMIRDIINEKKSNPNTNYCVRVTADEGELEIST